MYCEYLILDAKNGDKESLSQLFFANYNFIYVFKKDLCVHQEEMEDFAQMCYIAMERAIHSFQIGGLNSFLSYYRRCVQHEFYLYKLHMRYPTRISRHDIKQVERDGFDFSKLETVTYSKLDDALNRAEIHTVSSMVWQEVETVLGSQHCGFLKERFIRYAEYEELLDWFENEFVTIAKLRDRQAYLCRRLRKSDVLKKIASDFFSIRC